MSMYVLGFIFSKEKVLLIRKAKPEWQAGMMNGIGGKLEKFETIHKAMQRECLEETGINIPEASWDHCITMDVPNLCSRVFIFRAFQDFDTLHQVDMNRSDNLDEILCVCRIADPENNYLEAPLIPNLKWVIPMLLDKGLSIPHNIDYEQPLAEKEVVS